MTALGVLVTDAHTHREYDAHVTLSHVFTQLRAKNALLEERARQQGAHFLRVGLFCPAMSSTMADALGSGPACARMHDESCAVSHLLLHHLRMWQLQQRRWALQQDWARLRAADTQLTNDKRR
jgi:hypothetical protein